MVNEKIFDAEQMTLLMYLQIEMKRRNEETKRKNEDDILTLRKENEEVKRKFVEVGSSVEPTNPVGRSFTTPPALKLLRSRRIRSTPRKLTMNPI